jgi:2-hydroxy-3-oxopropionate reductase
MPKKIGFLGLGNMGSVMAKHLVSTSYSVTGYDPDKKALAAAVRNGVRPAASEAEAVSRADVVCSSLPTTEAVRSAFLGGGGALDAMRRGAVCFEHSTIEVGIALEICAAGKKKGVPFLDAPIAGSVSSLERKDVATMVGGERQAFEAHRDVLEAYIGKITYMGKSGNGLYMKLVTNHIYFSQLAALAEGLAFGKKAGLDPQGMVEFLKGTFVTNQLSDKGDAMARRDYTPAAELRVITKDLLISSKEANRIGAAAPLGTAARQQFVAAEALGHFKNDTGSVYESYLQAMGEKPKRGKKPTR